MLNSCNYLVNSQLKRFRVENFYLFNKIEVEIL